MVIIFVSSIWVMVITLPGLLLLQRTHLIPIPCPLHNISWHTMVVNYSASHLQDVHDKESGCDIDVLLLSLT